VNASVFVVGPRDKAGGALMDLARSLGFAVVDRYQGLYRAEKQLERTPLVFFFCSGVPDVGALRPMADAVRLSAKHRLRFAPLIYFGRNLSLPDTRRCIDMGFDDIIALPFSGGLDERILRQVGTTQVYYETPTYFGPDRRNRLGENRSLGSDRGGGQHRRIEIVRNPDRGVEVVRDDFVL
jgi:hypothetical protein